MLKRIAGMISGKGRAEHYGVSRATVAKALRRMAGDGLVEVVPQWGTFRT
jgi:DNA-binding GntR family transcriptional regulator